MFFITEIVVHEEMELTPKRRSVQRAENHTGLVTGVEGEEGLVDLSKNNFVI